MSQKNAKVPTLCTPEYFQSKLKESQKKTLYTFHTTTTTTTGILDLQDEFFLKQKGQKQQQRNCYHQEARRASGCTSDLTNDFYLKLTKNNKERPMNFSRPWLYHETTDDDIVVACAPTRRQSLPFHDATNKRHDRKSLVKNRRKTFAANAIISAEETSFDSPHEFRLKQQRQRRCCREVESFVEKKSKSVSDLTHDETEGSLDLLPLHNAPSREEVKRRERLEELSKPAKEENEEQFRIDDLSSPEECTRSSIESENIASYEVKKEEEESQQKKIADKKKNSNDETFRESELIPDSANTGRGCVDIELFVKRKIESRTIISSAQIIDHVTKCNSPSCPSSNCAKMKSYLQHGKDCQVKHSGGCIICKRIWTTLCTHAMSCENSLCRIPQCKAIRVKMRQLAATRDGSVIIQDDICHFFRGNKSFALLL
eukprot:CAMPEP_0194252774 /NCGR_PEP_ID=MMETSP0158-20130606/28374_1 /TAXON_ID=33649 /ORGANISM="Thalassionema nitzschioides, Strain L26-B" /LENGTH=428 /DNA_ID=CAMNT_0038990263 /DNA_START=48 /DNA_END=1334 /DNA_ORIENTATION=-